ncbi:hypothetical protein FRB99_006123, partial [Tulasnella sp. 403]
MTRSKKANSESRILNRDGRTNRPSMPNRDGDWTTDWSNIKMEDYYRAQAIVNESEWDRFIQSMRQTLPTAFRLPVGKQTTKSIAHIIENQHLPKLSEIIFEGERIDSPKRIPWQVARYPGGLAYEVNVPKRVLRKSPDFKEFHQFLVYQTEVGNMSRQETVSMIPPLLLDVQPHHYVLDMCAAPGSKTAQLIEALHTPPPSSFTAVPLGLVIANDAEYSRAQLLVHQSSRLPSPALLITNLDASQYPTLKNAAGASLSFDRILCDVPCSGDGTIRKNVGIWKSWNVGSGNGLHSLQLRILVRAMQLLRPGGRIVYSTCSMNPVENEAVVAAALNTFPGQFMLVPTSKMLPGLIRRPGLTTWTPALNLSRAAKRTEQTTSHPDSKDELFMFSSHESYVAATDGGEVRNGRARFRDTLWPPENVCKLGLEHCLRIYPHLQNTGAFFVAVLQKNDDSTPCHPIETKVSASSKRDASPVHEPVERESKKPKLSIDGSELPKTDTEGFVKDLAIVDEPEPRSFKELPFTFLDGKDEVLLEHLARLQLVSTFPAGNIFVRHFPTDLMKTFYLANEAAKEVIQHNAFDRIRLVSAGVKVLSRHDLGEVQVSQTRVALNNHISVPIRFPEDREVTLRFVHDGIVTMENFIRSEARIQASLADLKTLLESYFPLLTEFHGQFFEVMSLQQNGSYMLIIEPQEVGGVSLSHHLVLPLWKSGRSLSLMVNKQYKKAL